jgi:hypothetical protein
VSVLSPPGWGDAFISYDKTIASKERDEHMPTIAETKRLVEELVSVAEARGNADHIAEARQLLKAAVANAELDEAVQAVVLSQAMDGDPDALEVLAAKGTG